MRKTTKRRLGDLEEKTSPWKATLRANANKNQKNAMKVESWGSSDLFGLVICWRYS